MKKKMLLYANYFYPEYASTAQILTELCEGLSDKFDITVICSIPCYTGVIEEKYKKQKYYYEEYKGIKIIRVRVSEFTKTSKKSRIKHILTYFFNSIFATFKVGKQDLVYTISQPPVLGGMLGCIGKFITKGKLVYNIQDFNPEQIMAVNYSKNKFILKLMMLFDKHSCKKADLIVTVGKDMQQTLINRFKNKKVPKNVVINNWTNDEEVYPLPKDNIKIIKFKQKYGLDNKFVIMYSGNLGLYYDLENIIKIIEKYKKEENVAFAFIGEGGIKNKLEEYVHQHQMENVKFIPYQPKEDLIYSLNSADIHLVTNSKGIKGVSVPSKIYGCLATNVPVFGILEKDTEAELIITKSNCGIVAETGDYESIEKCFDEIIKDKDKFVKKHLTGRKYLENNLTRDKSVEKYKKEILSLLK